MVRLDVGLSELTARGGKILLYHGWNDSGCPYPEVPTWDGKGHPDDVPSYVCRAESSLDG